MSQIVVNDIHSQLNPTQVSSIAAPTSLREVRQIVVQAKQQQNILSIAGGRHSMGAQQFGTDTQLCDTRPLNRALHFDSVAGTIEVEAGIQWPELIDHLERIQEAQSEAWAIAQKQTGANNLTIGGAIAANVHGRGLQMGPIISDIESFILIDAEGEVRHCSRSENSELFRLVCGGYGLFGIVYSATLRLVPRRKLQRIVEIIQIDELMPGLEQRIADGYLYGDFQYVTDENSENFLRQGVFSCYRPVEAATPFTEGHKHLTQKDWQRLAHLAHVDKSKAFQVYAAHYLSTSSQIYWSDRHQEAVYLDDYHQQVSDANAAYPASEVITEIYVPREQLVGFLDEVRDDFRANQVNLIYGTIRLIQRDSESFLAWAKEPYACVIFNLHTEHSPSGIEHSAETFRRLITLAIPRGGSYYLAYHKYATRAQVEACYPQFSEFLRLKRHYDSDERFQSDWYRHYKTLFGEA